MEDSVSYFAIADKLYEYCDLIDTGRNDLVAAEIFAPDGVLDFGGPTIEGMAAIHDFFVSHPMFTRFPGDLDGVCHNISNLRIRFDGHAMAESSARVTAWHWHRQPDNHDYARPADLVIIGRYHDEWTFSDQGWRISRRRGGMFGTGVGAGTPPDRMREMFSGLGTRIPTWNRQWLETPSAKSGS